MDRRLSTQQLFFLDNASEFPILVGISARLDEPDFSSRLAVGVGNVLKNVLDAIREGDWFFEPADVAPSHFQPTSAIPGTQEKLAILAERARAGLPLWHEADRVNYEDPGAEL